jgi:hypothetical protein
MEIVEVHARLDETHLQLAHRWVVGLCCGRARNGEQDAHCQPTYREGEDTHA